MMSRKCSNCGCYAEPPLAETTQGEFVFCEECESQLVDQIEAEREAIAELEEKKRRGEICSMCNSKLVPVGGTTVWNHEQTQLIRTCLECKRIIDESRDRRA